MPESKEFPDLVVKTTGGYKPYPRATRYWMRYPCGSLQEFWSDQGSGYVFAQLIRLGAQETINSPVNFQNYDFGEYDESGIKVTLPKPL